MNQQPETKPEATEFLLRLEAKVASVEVHGRRGVVSFFVRGDPQVIDTLIPGKDCTLGILIEAPE